MTLFFALSALLACRDGADSARPPDSGAPLSVIDVHNHLFFRMAVQEDDPDGAAQLALESMDELGIGSTAVMPPPFHPSHEDDGLIYDLEELQDLPGDYEGRFAYCAGGGSLNPLLQGAVLAGKTSAETEKRFRARAEQIAGSDAACFGEMAALHLSMSEDHVFMAAPPDHALFLLLAEVAAEHGLPIDLHMEAVPQAMDTPEDVLAASGNNPMQLEANIAGLENLLDHRSDAVVIWDHVGWDNLHTWTVELSQELLQRHDNLHMSVKVAVDSPVETRVADEDGLLREEWLALFETYPDRFMLGADQFFVSPAMDRQFPPSFEQTHAILEQLPEALRAPIAYENAQRLLRLAG